MPLEHDVMGSDPGIHADCLLEEHRLKQEIATLKAEVERLTKRMKILEEQDILIAGLIDEVNRLKEHFDNTGNIRGAGNWRQVEIRRSITNLFTAEFKRSKAFKLIWEGHSPLADQSARIAALEKELEEERERLEGTRNAYRLMHDATIVLRSGMGGHNHWDHTGKHGAGCEVCLSQSEARAEANGLIAQAGKLATIATDPDAARGGGTT